MQDENTYILEPAEFHSMTEAQVLTDQLEQSLSNLSNVAANIKPQVVEMFSEIVNNAAEHGMSDAGAHCHVRLMPHRRGLALDSVITDRGPRHTGHPGEEPQPAGGIRRTSPQARCPGTHLRHRQSHQGNRSLDHLPGNARSQAGNYRSTLEPAGLRSTVQIRWSSRPPSTTQEINNLTNRQHYEVQVAAVNRVGTGQWASVKATPQAPYAAPPAPTGDPDSRWVPSDCSGTTPPPRGNTLWADTCTGSRNFRIIWDGPKGHARGADQWAAHINTNLN